jgi:hypothetical protein
VRFLIGMAVMPETKVVMRKKELSMPKESASPE